jgi:hypothetical protein
MFWWEQIRAAVPGLKLIAVVRHPADVLRSHRGVPWGEHDPHALAERWIAHARIVADASRIRGVTDVLVLRYEDVVAAPDAAREQIAAFLGTDPGPTRLKRSLVRKHPLFADHESWKERALGAIGGRRSGDRADLSEADRAIVEQACAGPMGAFGYEAAATGGPASPPTGESLEKVLAFRRWHASVAATPLPIY